jgi:hypothetical protein
MYYTIERLAAERVADFRREADRSGPSGGRGGRPPLVRALLRRFRTGRATFGRAAGQARGAAPRRLGDPLTGAD